MTIKFSNSVLSCIFILNCSFHSQSVRIVEKILGMRLARRPVHRKKPQPINTETPGVKTMSNESDEADKVPECPQTDSTAVDTVALENSEEKDCSDMEKADEAKAAENVPEKHDELHPHLQTDSEAPKMDVVDTEDITKSAVLTDSGPEKSADVPSKTSLSVTPTSAVDAADVTMVSDEAKASEGVLASDENANKPDEDTERDKIPESDETNNTEDSADKNIEVRVYRLNFFMIGF